MFSEIYNLIIILQVLDLTIFSGLYCHGVLRHESKKHEVNSEELDVLFDQFVEGNSCISLRIILFASVQFAIMATHL